MVHMDGVVSAAGQVISMKPSATPGYDYDLGIQGGQYTVLVSCGRDGDSGTVLLKTPTGDVGPVSVAEGSVHCYDVPYVNW
jgi:hypothetical protein